MLSIKAMSPLFITDKESNLNSSESILLFAFQLHKKNPAYITYTFIVIIASIIDVAYAYVLHQIKMHLINLMCHLKRRNSDLYKI